MSRIVEQPERVLLGVQVHPQPLGVQDLAHGVVVVRGELPAPRDRPVGVQAVGQRAAARRVAGGADHRVAQRLRDRDLRRAHRRVDHAEPPGVRADGDQAGGVEVAADLGMRGLAAQLVDVLAVLEELEAAIAGPGQELEHLEEAARERHQRPEVARILREVRPTQEPHRRCDTGRGGAGDAAARDRVADRELLYRQLPGRDQALTDRARPAGPQSARCERSERGHPGSPGRRSQEPATADVELASHAASSLSCEVCEPAEGDTGTGDAGSSRRGGPRTVCAAARPTPAPSCPSPPSGRRPGARLLETPDPVGPSQSRPGSGPPSEREPTDASAETQAKDE